jgi:hypothetical protein
MSARRTVSGRDAAHVVERERLGRVLDEVADVVHRRHELVDVVAIERRDERHVQQAAPSPPVIRSAACSASSMTRAWRSRSSVVLHQRRELVRRADDLLRVLVEELEEATFLGEQSAEHGDFRAGVIWAARV